MHFLVVGVSHRSAPVSRLERLAVSSRDLPEWLLRLGRCLGEGVILSTCNRTEIYTTTADPVSGRRRALAFLEQLDSRFAAAVPLEPFTYSLADDDAVRHLFRVTSGVASLVLGEPQIVGQVTEALRAAGEAGTVSTRLSRLFHFALRASRRVRARTDIGRRRTSVSSIGVQLLERAMGDMASCDVLLVGVGETGKLAARTLRRLGVRNLMVASRRPSRAREAAADLGARMVEMSDLGLALTEADAVITCTASPTPVLTAETVRQMMARRLERPLFILDLALPADVEPGVASVPGVNLYGLAALTGIAEEHRQARKNAVEQAEALIDREVSHFGEALTGLDAEPVIKALGGRAEDIRRRELARAMRRLPGLNESEQAVLDAMTRAIVKRLLADPIAFLRNGNDRTTKEAVAEAFDLGRSPAPGDGVRRL